VVFCGYFLKTAIRRIDRGFRDYHNFGGENMAKMSLEELRALRDSKKTDLKRRDVEGKEIQVIVGMGTCGIAAGAKSTLDAFLTALDENKLADQVLVRQTGCMGLCHSEPTVEVIAPGMPPVIYGKVDGVVAKEIVQKHLIGKELLNNHILDRPAADIV
jgi:NADP-reducing hydrogenase subunit HndB